MTRRYVIVEFNMDTGQRGRALDAEPISREEAEAAIVELRSARKRGDAVIHVAVAEVAS